MPKTSSASTPRRRISAILLFFALAFLAGAGSGPWLHFHLPAAASSSQQDGSAPPPAPLHDPGCALCHAVGSPALAAVGDVVLVPPGTIGVHVAYVAQVVPRANATPSRARAPPLS